MLNALCVQNKISAIDKIYIPINYNFVAATLNEDKKPNRNDNDSDQSEENEKSGFTKHK